VLLGCALAAGILYLALSWLTRRFSEALPFLLRPWGTPALTAGVVGVLSVVTLLTRGPAGAEPAARAAAKQTTAGNVIVVVVDTLRADHLPAYGYKQGKTPNLEAFAK